MPKLINQLTQINPIFNKRILVAAAIISILIWIIFKYFFMNINMIMDSYYYTYAAEKKLNVNIWPIGYSYFLRLIGLITHSPIFLVTFQFLLFQFSLFYFYIVINRFHPFPVIVTILYSIIVIFNPIIPFTSNCVLSDSIFTGLSIIWFSNLILLLNQPQKYMIISNGIILTILIIIRYNALYYPLISIAAFILCNKSISFKTIGILVQTFCILSFVLFIRSEVEKMSGHPQFSPFGGWKLASNSLYMYENIPKEKEIPIELAALEKQVRIYFDTPHEYQHLLKLDHTTGSWFMFDPGSPLIIHAAKIHKNNDSLMGIVQFVKSAPLMSEYGMYLLKRHPIEYAQYYMIPNFIRYMIPPLEIYVKPSPFLDRSEELATIPRNWFGIQSVSAPILSLKIRSVIFNLYPMIICMLHIFFILSVIFFAIQKGYKIISPYTRKIILLLLSFWAIDFAFNIFASGVVLRYLMITALIEFTFILITATINWKTLDVTSTRSDGV